MAVPTVFLVGTERLPLIPEYLNLGSVVVVAPDPGTLKRWRAEQDESDADDENNIENTGTQPGPADGSADRPA